MLWIILTNESASHQIIGANVAVKDDIYEMWITRPGNKGLKIKESPDKKEVMLYKDAIDYAIKQGESVLELD